MNILFISPNSPFESIGGIERYITNLINYYKNNKDCNVFIILPIKGESFSEKIGNVTIFYENSFYISKNVHRQKDISKNAQLFSKVLTKIIKSNNIDIITAENVLFSVPTAYVLLLNMVAIQQKVPLVLRLHSFAVTELQAQLINQLMWNHISCVSKSVAGDCFHKGADINSLSTHYLGVDFKEFNDNSNFNNLKSELKLSENSKVILTATRIIHGKKSVIKAKGIVNLIQAFSKLSNRYPDLHLLIAVGKAPENLKEEFESSYKMLLGYIKLHNIEKKTIIKMFKLNEMPMVYKSSDLFVLASENETFGQVFIESMACGLPVIGTKVGGIPEIISDSYNGYLIHPNDSSSLAQKIEKLITDSSIRKKFIKAGITTVKRNYSSLKQFKSFESMLRQLVNNPQ